MVGPNKILTVSYGTFSCTLEGFDDPFSTMREIAEYFRDLAAEDRYFGAEPPTPDAEMLHRIAEREVRKRVEARVEDDGIVLRQVEGQPAEPAAAPEPAAAAEPAARPEPAPEPAAPPAEEAAESVAAKLARIRAAAAQDIAHDRDTYVEDASAEDISVGTPISAAFQDVQEEPRQEAPAEEAAEKQAPAPEVREEPAAEQAASEEEREESEAATPAEPQDAEAAAAEEDAGEVAREEVDEEAEEEPAATPAPDKVAIARVVRIRRSQFKAAVMAEELQEAPGAAEDAGPEAAQAPTEEEKEAGQEPAAPETAAEPQEPEQPAEEAAQASEAQTQEPAEEESAEEAAPTAAEEPAEEAPQEEAPEKLAAEAAKAETEETERPEKSPEPESTLSPEDEAELRATLEQIQREAEAERRAEKEGRALLEKQDIESSPNSVSRILEVTNSELEESEGSRRRSAIAHLKAAVAATRADKRLSRKKAEEEAEELNQYREDLARVVRPRRPADAGRPAGRRMPPLMLVSEQRVDLPSQEQPAPERSGTVRPRRITTGNLALDEHSDAGMGDGDTQENIFRDERTFAEFARRMGATELTERMEAAAAYFTFIEGRPHFTRPQAMRAVAALNENKDFSREEGLRAFGHLLRSGRIVKIGRGHFRASDATRFNPNARVAGE